MTIPIDCVRCIRDFVPYVFKYVNCEFHEDWMHLLLNSVIKIQRWYLRFRLVDDTPPYPVTKKTLMRFYITKYNKQWLKSFPRDAILKLNYLNRPDKLKQKYLVPTLEMTNTYTRTFMLFVREYDLSLNDFYYYGW